MFFFVLCLFPCIKALTKYKQQKMKRDAWQKCSFFSENFSAVCIIGLNTLPSNHLNDPICYYSEHSLVCYRNLDLLECQFINLPLLPTGWRNMWPKSSLTWAKIKVSRFLRVWFHPYKLLYFEIWVRACMRIDTTE